MGPFTSAKFPSLFPILLKKIPKQKVIVHNYSIFFHLDLFSVKLKSNDIKLYDYMLF